MVGGTLISNLSPQQKIFIFQSLNFPKQLALCFRASDNSFRVDAFHNKCDNIPDTFTIIRTEFGKTIAGYTHYKWNHTSGSVVDSARNTFILQLDLLQKMIPTSDNHLIDCHPSYGPSFGCWDIWICDNCNTNNGSYGRFPRTYNIEGSNRYT